MHCHRKSNQAVSPEVAGCLRSTLAAMPFKAATQHPGSSSPPSLLRWGCCNQMCMASFSNSSLLVLAWSICVASSLLIGWWFSHACSARADFSSAPFWHASRCSFILVSSRLTVSLMYFLPQLQGIWYTTFDLFSIPRVLLLKEAIHIRLQHPHLNRDGGLELPGCWVAALKGTAARVDRRQPATSGDTA